MLGDGSRRSPEDRHAARYCHVHAIFAVASHIHDFAENRGATQYVSADMTFADEFSARLSTWSDIQGHLQFLRDEAAKRKVIVELGVRCGNSAAALLAGAEVGGGHVWSVDIEQPQVPAWWSQSPLWTFYLGNDVSPEIIAKLPSQMDMLLIDTVHAYDHTMLELQTYVHRLNRGGIVCCHDTVSLPVAKALKHFCRIKGYRKINLKGSWGLGVIRV